MHTDIEQKSWAEWLPAGFRPYIYLARLDRPIGIWLLLLPGWWAISMSAGGAFVMNERDWRVFCLFALGAVIMRAAGCVINDLWDRNIDKKVERTRARPLAAGDISTHQGIGFLVILLFLGFCILIQMNIVTILLGILCLPLVVIYPLMKRWTWWPQAFLGIVFNFGALMGWSATTGIIELPALLLYVSGIFWTLGYDTIYAHQDKEDDALVGIKSTALKFGDRSKDWVTGFFAFSWVFLAFAAILSMKFWVLLCLIPAGIQLFWQIKSWKTEDASSSLSVFKSNREYGILVLLALLLGSL